MPLLAPAAGLIDTLKANELIPAVIPNDFQPLIHFDVLYNDSGKSVQFGNELSKEDAATEPDIAFLPTDDIEGGGGSYTLLMVDPDAPSRTDQKFGQWRHWVISGLTPTSIDTFAANAECNSPATAPMVKTPKEPDTPYIGPTPGPSTGTHRYTFLLFREPIGGADFTINDFGGGHGKEDRRHWNAVDFAKRKGLKLVGANFFLVNT